MLDRRSDYRIGLCMLLGGSAMLFVGAIEVYLLWSSAAPWGRDVLIRKWTENGGLAAVGLMLAVGGARLVYSSLKRPP